jgi:hypothetical protein
MVPVVVAAEDLEFDEDGWSRVPAAALEAPPEQLLVDTVAAAATAASTAAAYAAAEEAARIAAEAAAADATAASAAVAARTEREALKRARLQLGVTGGGGCIGDQVGGVRGEDADLDATYEPGKKQKKKNKAARRGPVVSFEQED